MTKKPQAGKSPFPAKRSPIAGAVLLALAQSQAFAALPQGGQFQTGAGSIGYAGNAVTVSVTAAPVSGGANVGVVNWQSFNVGAGNSANFANNIPGSSQLNLVNIDRQGAASQIHGAINGSGSSNQPTGLLNISGIGSVAGGTNGLAPTYEHMVDLESAVANANADSGSLAYLTNTKVRGKLRKTQEFASTNGKAVWTSMPGQRGVGDVLGYEAMVTNSVPSTLDKGTSTGVCSAIIFGNWADFVIGMWGGLDILLDPYTGATAGTRRVVAMQDVDFNARHAASFAAMKDALTA